MNAPSEMTAKTAERFYVIEKMTAARNAIQRGCGDLMSNREKVESNLQRAQDAYLELQKARKRILAALDDAQLAFRETEQDALANSAGKLAQGLSGFNLMSRNYQPACKALLDFAGKLPESQDTVNAAVIGRLMNQVRMGYYPTDPDNIDLILRGIRFPEGKTTNVFDPCCGCGKALRQIADGHNCFAYGVELDEYRAEEPRAVSIAWASEVFSTAESAPRRFISCS